MSEKLEYELSVKGNSLTSALNDGIKKSGQLEDVLQTAMGVFGGNLATKGFELFAEGIRNTIDFAKESVKAFSEQEDALNKLSQALRASGGFSFTALEGFQQFASELQRTSVFGDELVLSQLAVAKSFGATNQQAENLVRAAANLSATFGGGLEENLTKLGKTLSGSTGRLAQFIPELKNLTKEQLAAGEAANIINEKFGGAAANELKTYSGSVTALSNSFSDFEEELGRILAKNSVTTSFISGLTAASKILTDATKGLANALEIGISPMEAQRNKLKELGGEYNGLVDEITQAKETLKKFDAAGTNNILGELRNRRQLEEDIANAEQRQNEILKERTSIRTSIGADKNTPDAGTGVEVDKTVIENRQKLNDEILFLKQKLLLEENNLDLEAANAQIVNDDARNLSEIDRMTNLELAKIELEAQFKAAALGRTAQGEDERLGLLKIAAEKELALTKVRNDGIVKNANVVRDAEKKAATERIATQQATASTITGIIGTAANIASVLTKEGSKENFFIQKAAALAQAIVATNLAMAMANTVPPPGNIAAIAAARANGAIAISGIVAASIKGFSEGGIVGGNANGASGGPDNMTITARKDEMYLNAAQQSTLFNAISTGQLGGGDIVVQIDGQTIFKVVRNEIKKGYKL